MLVSLVRYAPPLAPRPLLRPRRPALPAATGRPAGAVHVPSSLPPAAKRPPLILLPPAPRSTLHELAAATKLQRRRSVHPRDLARRMPDPSTRHSGSPDAESAAASPLSPFAGHPSKLRPLPLLSSPPSDEFGSRSSAFKPTASRARPPRRSASSPLASALLPPLHPTASATAAAPPPRRCLAALRPPRPRPSPGRLPRSPPTRLPLAFDATTSARRRRIVVVVVVAVHTIALLLLYHTVAQAASPLQSSHRFLRSPCRFPDWNATRTSPASVGSPVKSATDSVCSSKANCAGAHLRWLPALPTRCPPRRRTPRHRHLC